MAFNFGALLKGGAAAARSIDNSRKQERAEQMLLEDRLAQKEMRDLQKRKLEDEINRPEPVPTWETRETDQGVVQVNPRTGEVRPLKLEDRILQPKPTPKPESSPSFSFQTDKDGNVVGINPKDPRQVVPTGVKAPPKATPEPAGAAARNAKLDAAVETLAILDEIAKDVEEGGTDIDPRSTRRAGMASKYAQFQLKLKDAAKLGALSQSDLDIMLNALNDPTSPVARAKVLGSRDTHNANVLAGTEAVRSTLQREIQRLSGGGEVPVVPRRGKELSPEDAAKAKADPGFAAWLKSQGFEVP